MARDAQDSARGIGGFEQACTPDKRRIRRCQRAHDQHQRERHHDERHRPQRHGVPQVHERRVIERPDHPPERREGDQRIKREVGLAHGCNKHVAQRRAGDVMGGEKHQRGDDQVGQRIHGALSSMRTACTVHGRHLNSGVPRRQHCRATSLAWAARDARAT